MSAAKNVPADKCKTHLFPCGTYFGDASEKVDSDLVHRPRGRRNSASKLSSELLSNSEPLSSRFCRVGVGNFSHSRPRRDDFSYLLTFEMLRQFPRCWI